MLTSQISILTSHRQFCSTMWWFFFIIGNLKHDDQIAQASKYHKMCNLYMKKEATCTSTEICRMVWHSMQFVDLGQRYDMRLSARFDVALGDRHSCQFFSAPTANRLGAVLVRFLVKVRSSLHFDISIGEAENGPNSESDNPQEPISQLVPI